MNPTLGMTRPSVYSALNYRPTSNRNIPAYNISSSVKANMMRIGPYTTLTYNARRL